MILTENPASTNQQRARPKGRELSLDRLYLVVLSDREDEGE
jgi:hypothetical protein